MINDPKIVLITGCSKGGIGYEYCKAFANQNCRVVASDIPAKLTQMSTDFEPETQIESIELDVTSTESVATAVKTVISKHGRIDILINNAGIASTGPLAELSLEKIKTAYEVNTLGQLRLTQHVFPHMASRRNGCIVNVGSVVGRIPTPWAGSYCASKSAVHAMSHCLRVELKPFGVNVVLVIPGAVRSNFGGSGLDRLRNGNEDWMIYKEFKEAIAERAKASQSGKAMDGSVFAKHVAKQVLRSKPPKEIVFGQMVGLFGLLSWSPLWVRDLFFANRFKLNKKV